MTEKRKKTYSKELTWDNFQKSLEEDKHLTEEQLEKKYKGLNIAWD